MQDVRVPGKAIALSVAGAREPGEGAVLSAAFRLSLVKIEIS